MNYSGDVRPSMLELHEVSFSYGERKALDRVSLKVNRGERVAVLGHNGSGKSTLVKILGALQVPEQGAYLISGREAESIPFHEFHRLIGVVFQDPESQIVAAVVEDDVAFAPENQGLPPEEIHKRVDEALAKVDMSHKRFSPVAILSGGEKQRVAISGALAAHADCLILDEPTAMLDPEGRTEVNDALRRIHETGTTIVQVTHQLENFDDIDKIFVLSNGRLIWQGITDDFWPRAEELGFELPPLYKLAKHLNSNFNVKSVAEAIEKKLSSIHPNSTDFYRENACHIMSEKELSFIDVRGLSFRFDAGEGFALHDINAFIPKGKWLSIIGRTGSGKSTLVQHFNGLYKIQAGSVLIEGKPLPQSGTELRTLRRRVGLVFQKPEDQLFSPTVREELSFAPRNAGLDGADLDSAVLKSLDSVGLSEDFLTRDPLALSGGERRIVAIASVLAAMPECIILDEPLAGLDAVYRKKILAFLSKLRDEGKSIVTITHDLDMALGCSDSVLVMDSGRSLTQGTPREVLPTLMDVLRPEALPDILRLSCMLHKEFSSVPLTWDEEELLNIILV